MRRDELTGPGLRRSLRPRHLGMIWIGGIIGAGLFVGSSAAIAAAGPTFANLTQYGGFMPHGVVAVLCGAVTVLFALTGAQITTVAAAGSAEPVRAAAKMSTAVVVRILPFYMLSTLADCQRRAVEPHRDRGLALRVCVDGDGVPPAGSALSGIIADGGAVL